MRITINTDQSENKPAAVAAATVAESDGGTAPVGAAFQADDFAADGGEPPAWLVSEIARASGAGDPESGHEDAGPGPQAQ
ncbi:MAG: hypothetical protein FJW30_06155 [Acidobacteria bacterium]|nr:hypothetical protein [Acidobacteriota bacterium]